MVTARRFRVRGRVQGVGFRYFTVQAARVEGIHGWVRNTAQGDVEVESEGEGEAMCRFETQLRHGPPGARVDEVETDEIVPSWCAGGFTVRA